MAELKTKETKKSPAKFVASIKDAQKREDAKRLLRLMKEATGKSPRMWGASIVGFGKYHYKSERSSQEGDWPMTGFSPRKQNLTVYVMPGFKKYRPLLKKLGTHKTSVGCLYIKRLADVDERVLKSLIKKGFEEMKRRYK
jgi:hypothetical protein